MWAWRRDAGVGTPSAARSAARACTNAAHPAAHHGSSPAASNAPMMPVSTSPEPAVAAHEPVEGCTSARPSGSATTVALPLSSTVTPSSAAARRAAAIRSAPTSPASRANSPVVRGEHARAGRGSPARRSACSASSVMASASTHERHVRGSRTAASSVAARVVGADAGPDRPRLGPARRRRRPRWPRPRASAARTPSRGGAGEADHAAGGQHRRARWRARRRPGRWPSRRPRPTTPWVYLSSRRSGHAASARPRRRRRAPARAARAGSGPSPMSTRCTGPQRRRGEHVHGLARAERDGRGRRVTAGAVDRAGVGVDAAGQVDGERPAPRPARPPRPAAAPARAARPARRCPTMPSSTRSAPVARRAAAASGGRRRARRPGAARPARPGARAPGRAAPR